MNLCWIGLHSWERWKVLEPAREGAFHANDPISGEHRIIGGRVEYQRRECLVCGKSQLRRTQAT